MHHSYYMIVVVLPIYSLLSDIVIMIFISNYPGSLLVSLSNSQISFVGE